MVEFHLWKKVKIYSASRERERERTTARNLEYSKIVALCPFGAVLQLVLARERERERERWGTMHETR